MSFIEGSARDQVSLFPPCVDDYVAPEALVRVVDAFVASLNLPELLAIGGVRFFLDG